MFEAWLTDLCWVTSHNGNPDQFGDDDSPLADANLNRIVHDAYKINIESITPNKDMSMREVNGLEKNISEWLIKL